MARRQLALLGVFPVGSGVNSVAFSPDGTRIICGCMDGTIRVWELATVRCVKTVQAHSHFVTCLAWGRQAASGASSVGVGVNGNGVGEGKSNGREEKVVNVVATGSVDQTVKIWLP